ncbi:hypothetical protein ElyMa_001345100 [Elysia marginata]|uniref:Uncharacterized protein n=1 Tax=Elysia marginata TaxID=1093978 RepID=A0AAV4IMN1_9GAST|nr:hypothetical protein ElyMa_001345100 [Elysia marginata]
MSTSRVSATLRGLLNLSISSLKGAVVQGSYKSPVIKTTGTSTNIAKCSPCIHVSHRSYGRKVKPKPPKITHFEYSGDLRVLPSLNKDTLLYNYQGLENEIKGKETLERLSSIEYATAVSIVIG